MPIPAKPGQPKRYAYDYQRNGTANLFMMFAPLQALRHIKVTDRHTAVDYAQVLNDLSDTHYPNVSQIVLAHPQAYVTLRSLSRRGGAQAG